ncbi:hypothetical protein P6C68_004376 [Escherichia coli]|nr:hypothetical protein [Escherichia coli]EJN3776188.1 hypothetical protein [Escherichia coli]EJN4322978.1 hypothetical protein [Escherichia coli]EJN4387204.1 hypothetical protein [Escherichia coli]EJN4420877.1 hypothetical protein [Escherichia coli]
MNMYEMIRSENAVLPEELEYSAWLEKVRHRLGMHVGENSLAWDLWADGCDVEDAVEELRLNGYVLL